MQLIDGKATATLIKQRLADEIKQLTQKYESEIGLAVIMVGDNPASQIYVANKIKSCEEVGIHSELFHLSDAIAEEELLDIIDGLNRRDDIHGILVQLPLPRQCDPARVIEAIAPEKDVDGFSYGQMGRLVAGKESLVPCTPRGVMALLEHYGIQPAGKHAVVIGRSNIVGKPMAHLLLQANATVTVCHSRTADLAQFTRMADILVVAIGKADFITGDMVKEGAVVIDVGMNRLEGRLTGDVDFASVSPKCSYITPVPGGVGPMTIAMLMSNTVEAYLAQQRG